MKIYILFKRLVKNAMFFFLRLLAAGRLPESPVIFLYHSIDKSGSPLSVSFEKFFRQMEYLKINRRPVITFDDLYGWLRGRKKLSPGSVLLTFDDGFRNNLKRAFPLLRRYGFPATIFLVSGACGKTNHSITGVKNTFPLFP